MDKMPKFEDMHKRRIMMTKKQMIMSEIDAKRMMNGKRVMMDGKEKI